MWKYKLNNIHKWETHSWSHFMLGLNFRVQFAGFNACPLMYYFDSNILNLLFKEFVFKFSKLKVFKYI